MIVHLGLLDDMEHKAKVSADTEYLASLRRNQEGNIMTETKTETPKPIDIELPPPEGGAAVIVRNGGETMPIPRRSGAESLFAIMRDPSTDIVKLKEYMALYKDLAAEEARLGYNMAMSEAQAGMKPVVATLINKSTGNSKYPSQNAIDDAIRPFYTKHGFSISFDTGDHPQPDWVRLFAYVEHERGHKRQFKIDIPADGKGAKGGDVMTKTHAVVSAVTYGKRTLLGMIFNLAIDRDDDGNSAGKVAEADKPKLSAAQIADLQKLIEDTGGSVDLFLKHLKLAALGDIFVDRYEAAKKIVKDTAALRKKAKGNKQ